MRSLTKKYIFECRLKGNPIDLTDYQGDDWNDLVIKLEKLGILSDQYPTVVKVQAKENSKLYYLQYPIKIRYKDKNMKWHTQIMLPN